MIILNEVAAKLNAILNGTDPETSSILRTDDLEYVVNTHGFHLDRIDDATTNKNFIPVFISSMGGQINAVPGLKQIDATIPITFYFPIRLKNVMFKLNDFLADVFVGKTLDYGTFSGKAISNISFARYGEIQDLDLKQFKEWIGETFQQELEVSEPFMSMDISLYLSSSGSDFIYGNNVTITQLKIYRNNVQIFSDNAPICIDRVDIGSSEPAVEQLFGDTHSKGFGANAAYTKQLPIIIKNNLSYYELLKVCEVDKDIQSLKVEVTERIPISGGLYSYLDVTNTYFVTNYSRRNALGQLVGISLTLSPRKDD